jgi:hypothetical protein
MTGVVVDGCAWGSRATRLVARGPSPRWFDAACVALPHHWPGGAEGPLHTFPGGVGQESPNRLKPRVAGLTVTETPEAASWRIWSRISAVGEPKILIAAVA